MNSASIPRAVWLLTLGCWLGSTGCTGLKPVAVFERHFVLSPSPLQAMPSELLRSATPPSLGIGPVRIPSYLSRDSFAVRRGANEISYLETVRWAERLDRGGQRVLAANLGALLPTMVLRSSSWASGEVGAVVQVRLDRFDIDTDGVGVLEAEWSVAQPGDERLLRSGQSRHRLQGPPPSVDPDGAVGTLNGLLGRLSEELARALTSPEHPTPD